MNEKKLYQQKLQAQIDEWKAEIDKMKAKAAGASADARLKMNEDLKMLQSKLDEGKAKLAELAAASEDAWESLKGGLDSAWESMKSAFKDAASKFKD